MSAPAIHLFGEVLFDCFPDGRVVLGGAPFNVAWHLQAFGQAPRLVSRVGDDKLGEAVYQAMNDWGMDLASLRIDDTLPTGQVQITLEAGEPSYEIVHPVAWDAIEPSSLTGEWLYHGTLALRDKRSRDALASMAGHTLRETEGTRRFLDVNLRDPWWDRRTVLEHVDQAHWVKLNQDELDALAPPGDSLAERARKLFQAHALDGLIVTRGAAGAVILDRQGVVGAAPAPVTAPGREAVVDTVGAGDAFSSVVIHGLLQGWSLETALERALAFAAAVCGLRGATVADSAFYEPFLMSWQS